VFEPAQRRSALAAVYTVGPFGANGATPGVSIAERRNRSLVHVEYREDDAESALALAGALGFALPTAGHAADKGFTRVIWAGPGRWLVTAPEAAHGVLAAELAEAVTNAAVNDVSSSRTVLRLAGPVVRDLLASGCPLDFDAGVFKPGMAATSVVEHLTVTLDCLNGDTFDVYVARGYAVSFWEWLLETAQEFGGSVAEPI